MIIQNSTDIKTEYFLDKNGDPSPIDVQYEKHNINPNGLVQLRNIPSIHTVFNITTKNGINVIKYNKVDKIVNQTDFTVDYPNGLLTFHSSQISKEIQVSYTNAIGRLSISSDRIFTKIDNQGNIVQTLNTLIEEGMEVLSNLETIGGANKIINELKGYVDSAKGLSTTIIEGSNTNNNLKKTDETARTTNSTLNSTITNADGKIQEMTEWVNKNGDVVNLNNRVTTTEGKLNIVSASLEQNVEKTNNVDLNIKNMKKVNVLDYGAKGDGITDNTQIINSLLANNETKNLYFPNGTYIANLKIVLPNSTIVGQSMNDTVIKQIGENHIIENKAHFTLIKNITLEGTGINLVSDSCGVYQKSINGSTYINYLKLFDVCIKNINSDGVHIEGSNVENIFSNVTITNCGKRNFYNEGHDLFVSNIKLQRANLENYINKGNNVNGVNFHIIYGNLSQIDTDKNLSELRYSWVEQGKRFSYSNMDVQDCYGHGVKLQNATGSINGLTVDSVGINQPESSWWLPNTANNCIGIDIIESDVVINGRVVNWHNNTQGACYRTDNSSELTGTITYETLCVKEPIIRTWNIHLTREDEVNKFLGLCNLLQKSTITWDTTFTFNGSGSPVYDNNGRYGTRLLISNATNSVSLLPNNTKRFNQDDFEITFTFTPNILHDGVNTRWIYNSTFGNLYIEILRASDGKTTTNATIGSELFTKNFKDTMAVGEPYRIFIKYKNNKINFRIYHYSVLKFNESYTFTTAKTFGETPEIVLGNLKTGQTYWCGNGGFENFMLSRAIPDYIDFKQIDQRIDTTPYTIYKSEFNNKL